MEIADVQELALHPVIADADVVAASDGVDERLHRLVRRLVGEVARADPAGEAADAVVDRLLLQDHVEDVAARADVAAQRLGDGAARFATHLPVRLAEQVQRHIQLDLLAAEIDPDPGAQLLEQAHPGPVADRAEVGQDPLFRLRELVRTELALVLDEVAVGDGFGVGVQACSLLVGDLRQLQREEDQVHAALRGRFPDASQQPARGVVLRVLAVEHVGVDLGLGGRLFVVRQLAHHRGKRFGVERRDLALESRLERLRPLELAGQRGLDRGVVGRAEKVAEVPADLLRTGGFQCFSH